MIAIPDPDVVFTDLALAALGGYLAWRLRRDQAPGELILAGLASAAFWGALFHAFFPAKTATSAGFAIWLLVAFSIGIVAESLLDLSLKMWVPSSKVRRVIVLLYCVVFAGIVLFVDESFSTVVRLYVPTVVLAMIAAALDRWWLVLSGLLISLLAAVLQQAHVALHPVYFDHNAVYHVLEGVALFLLYRGFHEHRRADSAARA